MPISNVQKMKNCRILVHIISILYELIKDKHRIN